AWRRTARTASTCTRPATAARPMRPARAGTSTRRAPRTGAWTTARTTPATWTTSSPMPRAWPGSTCTCPVSSWAVAARTTSRGARSSCTPTRTITPASPPATPARAWPAGSSPSSTEVAARAPLLQVRGVPGAAVREGDRHAMRAEHRGELALARLEVREAALQARVVLVGAGGIALAPGRRREQRDARLAVGEVRQRLGRRVQPLLVRRRQQRRLEQRPQRRQPGVPVLQRGHRQQVGEGQVARVLDLHAEQLLREQRGVGAGHAGLDQVALER